MTKFIQSIVLPPITYCDGPKKGISYLPLTYTLRIRHA